MARSESISVGQLHTMMEEEMRIINNLEGLSSQLVRNNTLDMTREEMVINIDPIRRIEAFYGPLIEEAHLRMDFLNAEKIIPFPVQTILQADSTKQDYSGLAYLFGFSEEEAIRRIIARVAADVDLIELNRIFWTRFLEYVQSDLDLIDLEVIAGHIGWHLSDLLLNVERGLWGGVESLPDVIRLLQVRMGKRAETFSQKYSLEIGVVYRFMQYLMR